MQKLLTIIWKELYTTYTDRNLLLVMLVTPLALATIISLAFSGFISGSNDVPLRDVAVAVVNLDQGATLNGQAINYGSSFVQALVPPADATAETLSENALFTLTNAVALEDEAAARAAVDEGGQVAAIIIPADFSQRISANEANAPADVVVYANRAAPISSSVVYSLAQGITNQITSGTIAVAAANTAINGAAQANPALSASYGAAGLTGQLNDAFAGAFQTGASPITIAQQTVTGDAVTFNPLVQFGSAQAIFFMSFTAFGSIASLLQERRDGTLQRMLVTPTPRILILIGKLAGAFFICATQVALLLVALTVVGSLIAGELQIIWGTNIPLIILVVLVTSLAICGLATLIAGLSRTPEQINIIGGVVSLAFAVFSGVFFNVQGTPLVPLSRLTPNFWGMDAFMRLSLGDNAVGLNLLVLLLIGILFFGIGFALFNRRAEV